MGTDELMLFLKIPYFILVFSILRVFLIKKIIPSALVGYEMIIAISYPVQACEIIGKLLENLCSCNLICGFI